MRRKEEEKEEKVCLESLKVALYWFCQTRKGDVKLKVTRKHKNPGFLYAGKKQQSGVFFLFVFIFTLEQIF